MGKLIFTFRASALDKRVLPTNNQGICTVRERILGSHLRFPQAATSIIRSDDLTMVTFEYHPTHSTASQAQEVTRMLQRDLEQAGEQWFFAYDPNQQIQPNPVVIRCNPRAPLDYYLMTNDYEISVRADHALENLAEKYGVRTFKDLTQLSEMQIRDISGMQHSKQTFKELKNMLESVDLRFGMSPTDIEYYRI